MKTFYLHFRDKTKLIKENEQQMQMEMEESADEE